MNVTPVNSVVKTSFIKHARKIAIAAVLSAGVIASASATSTNAKNANYEQSKTAAEASANYGKASVNMSQREPVGAKVFWGLFGAGALAGGIASVACKKHKDE